MSSYSMLINVVSSVMMLITLVNSLHLKQEYETEENTRCQRVIDVDRPDRHFIIRGNEAFPGEFPHQVTIYQEGNFTCGGVIIDEYHILTAAHCIANTAETFEEIGMSGFTGNPNKFSVAVGEHNLVEYDGEQFFEIEKAVFHSGFLFDPSRDDIAILRTKKKMKFNLTARGSGSVAPACIPQEPQTYRENEQFLVSGWGSTLCNDKHSHSENLKKSQLILRPNVYCLSNDAQGLICARGIEGSSVFHGDSGGGLVRLVNYHYELVGIVSWGLKDPRCLLPATFTRVDAYLDWIRFWVNE